MTIAMCWSSTVRGRLKVEGRVPQRRDSHLTIAALSHAPASVVAGACRPSEVAKQSRWICVPLIACEHRTDEIIFWFGQARNAGALVKGPHVARRRLREALPQTVTSQEVTMRHRKAFLSTWNSRVNGPSGRSPPSAPCREKQERGVRHRAAGVIENTCGPPVPYSASKAEEVGQR